MLVVFAAQSSTGTAAYPTANAGTWAQHGQTSGTGRYGAVLSKVLQAGETTFTFTFPSLGNARKNIIAVAVAGTGGVHASSGGWTRTAAASPFTIPSQTGVPAGSLLLTGYGATTGAPNIGNPTAVPTGWAQVATAASNPAGTSSSDWLHVWSKVGVAGDNPGPSGTMVGPTLADWKQFSLVMGPT